MPVPVVLRGVAAATGVLGIVKNIQAAVQNKSAKSIVEEAQEIYEAAKGRLEKQREITSADLDDYGRIKLKSYYEDIGGFIQYFKCFKKINIEGDMQTGSVADKRSIKMNIKEMSQVSVTAQEVVKGGIATLGAGAVTGIAAYGGTMMFASASTGTAISALSGVAAQNATLAWLGGGAKAAGGLGMAGGSAVLGGLVLGPVLAVQGIITAAKSKEKLAKAKETYTEAQVAAEKMDTMTAVMGKVSETSKDYKSFIIAYSQKYQEVIENLRLIYERTYEEQANQFWNKVKRLFGIKHRVDVTKISEEDQKYLHYSWLVTQVLYKTLVAPLMTENGEFDEKAEQLLLEAREQKQNLIGD